MWRTWHWGRLCFVWSWIRRFRSGASSSFLLCNVQERPLMYIARDLPRISWHVWTNELEPSTLLFGLDSVEVSSIRLCLHLDTNTGILHRQKLRKVIFIHINWVPGIPQPQCLPTAWPKGFLLKKHENSVRLLGLLKSTGFKLLIPRPSL